jgi:hypothetical protein
MTPQGVPQHIQIEMARRELKMLIEQRSIAEQGVKMLSGVSEELAACGDPLTITGIEKATLAGIVALVSLRLLELQHSLTSLVPRIAELEGALKIADSPLSIPGLRIRS